MFNTVPSSITLLFFLGLIPKELLSSCEPVVFWKLFGLVHRATHPGRDSSGTPSQKIPSCLLNEINLLTFDFPGGLTLSFLAVTAFL